MDSYLIENIYNLFWELSLLIFSFSVIYLVRERGSHKSISAVDLMSCLAFKLLLAASIPQTLAFLHLVSFANLLAISLVLLFLSVIFLGSSGIRRIEAQSFFYSNGSWRLSLVSISVVILILPAVAASIAPIIETDSIHHSNWIFGFMDGSATPFDFPNNYVALWESIYVPSFVLTNSVYFSSMVSVQAVILVALASYAISNQMGLNSSVSLLIALVALTSGHLWGSGPTGAGTLKNDAISAAGVLLFVLSALRFVKSGDLTKETTIIMMAGLVFASVKFSGPVMAVIILVVMALFYFSTIRSINSKVIISASLVVLIFLILDGLYYFRNFYELGNPIYPFIIKIGAVSLPGSFDAADIQRCLQQELLYFTVCL